MSPKSERFEMRLDPVLIERIDQWRETNGNLSRAEAARTLILHGIDRTNPHGVQLSDGEKVIIAMLADQNQPKAQRSMDTGKIMDAIYGGHYWSLKWQMAALLHDHVDEPGALSLVLDTLDVWTFIEDAYAAFSDDQRKTIEDALGPLGRDPKFIGFDGNHESTYKHIADHLINDMDRFTQFKGRSLNSHMPRVARYAKMIRAFQPMRSELVSRHPMRLTPDEVITLLKRD
jgi:hypothetical protein